MNWARSLNLYLNDTWIKGGWGFCDVGVIDMVSKCFASNILLASACTYRKGPMVSYYFCLL